jgi:hypothetical protein
VPLYHFTDKSNVPSIQRCGLLSWKRLVAAGVAHVPASDGPSRSLDLKKELEDYVRLAISDYHPMAYLAEKQGRVEELVWLTIDERVLRFGPLFSNKNATANDAIVNDEPSTAFDSGNDQAEVLIRGYVALRWIRFPPYALRRGA